jgi:hypothetical protein
MKTASSEVKLLGVGLLLTVTRNPSSRIFHASSIWNTCEHFLLYHLNASFLSPAKKIHVSSSYLFTVKLSGFRMLSQNSTLACNISVPWVMLN